MHKWQGYKYLRENCSQEQRITLKARFEGLTIFRTCTCNVEPVILVSNMGTLERENYKKREKCEHDWEDGPNLGIVILLIISEFGIQHLRKNIAAGETLLVIAPLTLTILTSLVSLLSE